MPGTMLLTKKAHPTDPRWFIWTIVFLLVTGVSLVTYITYTSIVESSEVGGTLHVQRDRNHVGAE